MKETMRINFDSTPQPMRGDIEGTWAHTSITRRLPEIGMRIIEENSYPEAIEKGLLSLIAEIPWGKIKKIQHEQNEACEVWNDINDIINPYAGQNWLQAPWFFAEFYFYWRVLHATGYFGEEEYAHCDPFRYQKREGLKSSLPLFEQSFDVLGLNYRGMDQKHSLEQLLHFSVSGNKMDLSLWPVGSEPHSLRAANFEAGDLVVDHSGQIANWLSGTHLERVDFFIDNAGFELLADLLLADFLLYEKLVNQIIFHLKPFPIFVSDAMEEDVLETVDFLQEYGSSKICVFAKRVKSILHDNKLLLSSHNFWGQPLPLWEAPTDLMEVIKSSDLLVSKGDANYRRVLGDLIWDRFASLSYVLHWLPVPLLFIRILKSEIGLGFSRQRVNTIQTRDPLWMQNGKWGLIQLWEGNNNSI